LLAGILLSVLSYLLFKRRKSEKIGDTVVFPWMKTVFSYALSFTVSVTISLVLVFMILYYNDRMAHRVTDRIGIIIILCIVGFITFIESIMIVEKKFRIFSKRNMVRTLIFTIIIGIIGIAYLHDIFNIEGYVPNPDKVSYISVQNHNELFKGNKNHLTMSDSKMKQKITELHKLIIDNMEDLEKNYEGDFSNDYSMFNSLVDLRGNNKDYYYIDITYRMKNNESISRRYRIYKGTVIDEKIQNFIEANKEVFVNIDE